jgi:hypothetical protein
MAKNNQTENRFIIVQIYSTSRGLYAICDDNETLTLTYNPLYATTFASEQEANAWIVKYSPRAKYSQVVLQSDAIKEYNHWIENEKMYYTTLKCINNALSRPYNGETLEEVIDEIKKIYMPFQL